MKDHTVLIRGTSRHEKAQAASDLLEIFKLASQSRADREAALPGSDVRTLAIQYLDDYPQDSILLSDAGDRKTMLDDMLAYLSAASQLMCIMFDHEDAGALMNAVMDVYINTAINQYTRRMARQNG